MAIKEKGSRLLVGGSLATFILRESGTGNFADPGMQFVFWREGERRLRPTNNHPLVLAAPGGWVSRSWAQRRHISGSRAPCRPAVSGSCAPPSVVPEWGDNSRSLPDSGPTSLNPNTGQWQQVHTNCVHLRHDGIPTHLGPLEKSLHAGLLGSGASDRHSTTTLPTKYEVHHGLAEHRASLSLNIPPPAAHPALATSGQQAAAQRSPRTFARLGPHATPNAAFLIPNHTGTLPPFGCPHAVSRNGPLVLGPRAPVNGIVAPLASAGSPRPTRHPGRRRPESNLSPRPPYSTSCFPGAPSPRRPQAPRRAMPTS